MAAFWIYLEDKPRGFADQLDGGVRERDVRIAAEEVSVEWVIVDKCAFWGLLSRTRSGHVHLRCMLENQWSVRGTAVWGPVSGLET